MYYSYSGTHTGGKILFFSIHIQYTITYNVTTVHSTNGTTLTR